MSISSIFIIKVMPFLYVAAPLLKHCVQYNDKLLQRTLLSINVDGPVHQSAYLCTRLSVLRTERPLQQLEQKLDKVLRQEDKDF
jgi:hypothetical protein